ncbi:unnamed protein product [Scytosiphon promiscuus]
MTLWPFCSVRHFDQNGTEPVMQVSALVHAVRRFRRDRDVTKRSAQHRVVLRKLWAKMAEDGWRTVAKAALVLHCIARALSVD